MFWFLLFTFARYRTLDLAGSHKCWLTLTGGHDDTGFRKGRSLVHRLFLYAVFRYNAEKVIPIRDSGKYATFSPRIGKVTVL